MNILIVGHEGFVGTGLAAYFSPRHRVMGCGRRDDLFRLTRRTLEKKRVDVLINCAVAFDRTSKSLRRGSDSYRVNVEGARHLADALKGTDIGWFQISTKDVFGDVYRRKDVSETPAGYRPKWLVDDDQPFAPKTAYAKSKLLGERAAARYPRCNVIRLSTVYHERPHPKGNWMQAMARAGVRGEAISLSHNGRQFRDPLHTDDLGRLIEALAERGFYGYAVNAGGGEGNVLSVLEYARLAAPRSEVLFTPGNDFGFAFGNRRARSLVGWRPRVECRERIAAIVAGAKRARA